MFNLFSKNKTITTLPIQTDIHSHILPGIDDGAPDIATSITLIKGLQQLGIQKIIATPHIIGDLYRNTPDTINTALQQTKAACANENINIELSAAAEYMLDDHFINLLRTGQPLMAIKDNIILTEQSYASPTSNLDKISFEIITSGYQPIMAHPERYNYYHHDHSRFHYLVELGYLLQVNLLSLTGYYGKPVAKAARYILKHELATFVGTDIHHIKHLNALEQKKNLALFDQYAGKAAFNNL